MLHINRVTLLGHAGRDPEFRTMQSGDRTASFSLATTRRWKDRDGKPAEATDWHRVVVFGAAVKAVEELVAKGAALLVEGPPRRPRVPGQGRQRPAGHGDRGCRAARHGEPAVAAPGGDRRAVRHRSRR